MSSSRLFNLRATDRRLAKLKHLMAILHDTVLDPLHVRHLSGLGVFICLLHLLISVSTHVTLHHICSAYFIEGRTSKMMVCNLRQERLNFLESP